MIPSGQRPRAAVPQNRQMAPQRRLAGDDPYPGVPSRQPQYIPQPSSYSSQAPHAPQAYQQHAQALSQYGDDDEFVESQRPQPPRAQNFRQPMHYTDGTPVPPRRAHQPDPNMTTPQQPSRRPLDVFSENGTPIRTPGTGRPRMIAGEGGKGSTGIQLAALYTKLDTKMNNLSDEFCKTRDATHDIKEALKTVATRDEMQEDIRDYLNPALVQMKSDIINAFNKGQRDTITQVEERLRPLKDELTQLRAQVAAQPQLQQSNTVTNTGLDKTTQTLLEHLVAALRPVDELKACLLPLNLPQMQMYLGNVLQTIVTKSDQILVNTRDLPGAQSIRQDIMRRLSDVDTRTASQERADKDSRNLLEKVDAQVNALQADTATNTEALAVMRKEADERAEAKRQTARRRQNTREMPIQTDTPAPYTSRQTGPDLPGALVYNSHVRRTASSSSTSNSRPVGSDNNSPTPNTSVGTSPEAVGSPLEPSLPNADVSDATHRGSLTAAPNAFHLGAPPAAPKPTAKTTAMAKSKPTPKPLKRRAPAKKRRAPATAPDDIPTNMAVDSFEHAVAPVTPLPNHSALPATPRHVPSAVPSTPDAAQSVAPTTPPPSHWHPWAAPSHTTPFSKKRKSVDPEFTPRRRVRERKIPQRYPDPDASEVLVPGTQATALLPAALPPKRGKGKGKATPPTPPPMWHQTATTSSGQIIDLSADSLNRVESSSALNPAQRSAQPTSDPSQPAINPRASAIDPSQPVATPTLPPTIPSQPGNFSQPPPPGWPPTASFSSGSNTLRVPPSSSWSGVPETELAATQHSALSSIEPTHITRSSTQQLPGQDRAALFGGFNERLDLDDPLRRTIVEDDDDEVTGSQLIGLGSYDG